MQEDASAVKLGRKRDATRDLDILDAALDVLAEVGYTGMTVDMVAARAGAGKATVYRRWASKEDLVLDAVTRMKHDLVGLEDLPDTGTLRGDLLALYKPQTAADDDRGLKVMAGLASMVSHDAVFAEAGYASVVEPWAVAYRRLIGRAVDRGEVPAGADVERVSYLVPHLAAFRAMVERKNFDAAFLTWLVDGVVLPALLHPPG